MLKISWWLSAAMVALMMPPLGASAQTETREVQFFRLIDKAHEEWLKSLPQGTSQPSRQVAVDLAVPDAPALTVLGVSGDAVVHPTSPKQLTAGLINGLDPNGNLQTGIAIETSPFLLLGGDNLSIREYQKNYSTRLLARTGLSVATTKASDNDKAARLAIGVTLTPWDRGDPRKQEHAPDDDPVRCIVDVLVPKRDAVTELALKKYSDVWPDDAVAPMPSQAQITREMKEELDKRFSASDIRHSQGCRDKFRQRAWNESSLKLGLAPTWLSADSSPGNLAWSGLALFATLGYGFEEIPALSDSAQLLMHVRYRSREMVPDTLNPGTFINQDALTLAGQLRFSLFRQIGGKVDGGADLNFLGEYAYTREERRGRPDNSKFRYAIGAEYRLTDDFYLKLTAGTEEGDKTPTNSFVLFNVKYNFSDKPTPLTGFIK